MSHYPDPAIREASLISTGSGVSIVPQSSNRNLRILVTELCDAEQSLNRFLKKKLANGGIAGIICNTVASAIKIYSSLPAEFQGDAFLTHSRFVAPDRMRNDETVLELAGTSSKRNSRRIIIGTQVLEQSLDIDFDILITHKASLESVVQRMGRLHRHDRKDHPRPDELKHPQLVFIPEEQYRRGEEYSTDGEFIYGEWPLELTHNYFSTHRQVNLPQDIPKMVEYQHSDPAGYQDMKDTYFAEEQKIRSLAKPWIIGTPTRYKPIYDLVKNSTGDERGKVRAGESSPEIIMIFNDGDQRLWVPYIENGERKRYPLNNLYHFDHKDRLMLSGSTIRLPRLYGSHKWSEILKKQIDERIRTTITKYHSLKYEIPVIFTKNECVIADRVLTYDTERGLQDAKNN